jgi:RNA polymerase sigma-54 factor
MNADGEEVSNRKIMKTIEDLIEDENKSNPFSDDDITIELEKMGYKIARRTVAKYRENLKIPPKHARKLNS